MPRQSLGMRKRGRVDVSSPEAREHLTQNAEPVAHVTHLGEFVRGMIRVHAPKAGDLYVEAVALEKPYIRQRPCQGKGARLWSHRGYGFRQSEIPRRGAIASNAAAGRADRFEFDRS